MKAVVLHEYGGPEKLKFEDKVPDPQTSGDTVLIAAAAASVNPIDWKLRSGMRRKDSPLSFPAILGRDVSGVVRAVGTHVKHFKPGDRVLVIAQADETRVPEVVLGCPFRKFKLADQHGLQPSTIRHFRGR